MYEQLQQSGFLQKLPQLLHSAAQQLQAEPAAADVCCNQLLLLIVRPVLNLGHSLLAVLCSLRPLDAGFLGSPTGQQCIIPAAALAMALVQYASECLEQLQLQAENDTGPGTGQGSAGNLKHHPLLDVAYRTAEQVAGAVWVLSGGLAGDGPLRNAAVAAALLQAHEGTQCMVLAALPLLLAPLLPETGPAAHTGSLWLLASQLDGAYCAVLEQLGCSGEVILSLSAALAEQGKGPANSRAYSEAFTQISGFCTVPQTTAGCWRWFCSSSSPTAFLCSCCPAVAAGRTTATAAAQPSAACVGH